MEKSFIYPLRYTNTFRGRDLVPGAGDPEWIKTSLSHNDTRLRGILGKKMARGDLATVRWILSESPLSPTQVELLNASPARPDPWIVFSEAGNLQWECEIA